MSDPRERAAGSRGLMRTATLLLAGALFIFSSAVALRHWRGEHLLARAIQAREADSSESEALLQLALRYGSDGAAVELARLSYGRGDWRSFHQYAGEALRLKPGQGYVHILKAYALAAERMPESPAAAEKIMGECRLAVSFDPASGNLWLSYAELAFRFSRHFASRSGGTDAADGYRQESLGAYGRALRLEKTASRKAVESLVAAAADSEFIVAASRGSPRATLRRVAAILLDRGEWETLREDYLEGAIDIDRRRDAYWAAAEELRSRKLFGEALDTLRGYALAAKEDAPLAYLAGHSAEVLAPESASWSEAEKYYREALRLDDGKAYYRARLGVVLLRDGKLERAEKNLRQATAADPGSAWAWFHHGQALMGMEREEEALVSYRKAVELKPDNKHFRKALEALEK